MFTITKECSFSQIINKSEFICYLFPLNSIDEANNYLSQIRKKHFDASHNCYAYIFGKNGEYYRQSDDKEPSQTAGVVILDCLKKRGLTNIIAIVTRYFGGIKLGAGGLIRAYSSSTSKAIEIADIVEIIEMTTIEVEIDYLLVNTIQNLMSSFEEVSSSYTDVVRLSYSIPLSLKNEIIQKLISSCKNKIKINVC